MPNILKIDVDNPAELLNAGAYGAGAVIRCQSAATELGAYANLSGTGSTPTIAIVAGTYEYTGYDPNGTATTWYRTRYENAGGTIVSDWSASFQVGVTSSIGVWARLALVKRRLWGSTVADTNDDPVLSDYCDQVNAWMAHRMGRSPYPRTLTAALYDGYNALENGRCLPVPDGIRSISLLRVAYYTGGAWNTIPSTDYFLRPAEQQRDPGWPATELWMTDQPSSVGYFPDGIANIEITGAGGWSRAPDDLTDLGCSLVVRAFQARRTGQSDVTGTDETGRLLISHLVDARSWRVLERYAVKEVLLV